MTLIAQGVAPALLRKGILAGGGPASVLARTLRYLTLKAWCGGVAAARQERKHMTTQEAPKLVRRILVVEDEPFIAMGLEQLLPRLGYEVCGVATHLRDALAKAEAGGFDLAVLDVNLGGELSYRVADVLLARGKPFVFCTAYADVAFGRYAKVPVLQKPVEKKALARAIEEALSRAQPSRVA